MNSCGLTEDERETGGEGSRTHHTELKEEALGAASQGVCVLVEIWGSSIRRDPSSPLLKGVT